MNLKQAALSTCMIVFVLSSMLGMGLGLRVSEIVAPLRNRRLVTLSLVANFVVTPAVAVAAPSQARTDGTRQPRVRNGTLMVLLMVITVGYIPIVLPALLPGRCAAPNRARHGV